MSSPEIGAMRMPAMAARPAPTVQFDVDSAAGDQPRAAAASSFSATALVASPTRVKRKTP